MSASGNRESVRVSGSDTSGGLRLEVDVSGRSGDIDIEARVEDAGIDLPGPQLTVPEMSIQVLPTGVVNLRNSIRRLPGRFSSRYSMSRAFLSENIRITSSFPDADNFRFSEEISRGTSLPRDFTFGVNFTPIVVPDVPQEDTLETLPSVSITVSLTPTGFLRRFVSNLPSVEIQIPARAFVVDAPLSDYGCSELFSNIQSRVDEVQQRMVNADQLQDDLQELRDVRSEILSSSTAGSLSDISGDSFTNTTTRKLEEWRARAEQVETDPISGSDTIQSLQRAVNSVMSDVDDLPGSSCKAGFVGDLDRLEDALNDLEATSEQVDELQDEILNNLPFSISLPSCIERDFGSVTGEDIDSRLDRIDSRIDGLSRFDSLEEINQSSIESELSSIESDIRSIPTGDECREQFMGRLRSIRSSYTSVLQDLRDDVVSLTCDDVPQFIKNSVAEAEQQASSFSSALQSSRTQSRFNRILGNINDARRQVRRRVDNANPCQDQLLGRLDSAESTLRSAFSDIPRRGGPRIIDCDEEFQTIDERLTSLEDDVIALDPPVSTDTFEFIVNRADGLIERVKSDVDRERCRKQFIRRINGAVNRVGRVGVRTRVVTAQQITSEEIDERQQVINDLETRLDELREEGESRFGF